MDASITRTDAIDIENIKQDKLFYTGLLGGLTVLVPLRKEELVTAAHNVQKIIPVGPVFTIRGEEGHGPVLTEVTLSLSFEEAIFLSDALKK